MVDGNEAAQVDNRWKTEGGLGMEVEILEIVGQSDENEGTRVYEWESFE